MDYAVIPLKILSFLPPVEVIQHSLKCAIYGVEFAANLARRPTSNRGIHESRRGRPWHHILAVVISYSNCLR
jgi:hypothetical protein